MGISTQAICEIFPPNRKPAQSELTAVFRGGDSNYLKLGTTPLDYQSSFYKAASFLTQKGSFMTFKE